MSILITVLYIIIPIIVLFGIMFVIRRKREDQLGQEPSNKVTSIKAEDASDAKN